MKAGLSATQPRRSGFWLLYLAWFYPCWWLAQAAVFLGPEWLRGAIETVWPPSFHVGVFGAFGPPIRSMSQAAWTLAVAAATWLGCLAAAKSLNGARPVARLAAVWVAYALMARGLYPILQSARPRTETLALAAAGFAALVFSLARLPLGLAVSSRLTRAYATAGAVLAPLALLFVSPALFQVNYRFLSGAQTGLLLAAVAAAIVLAARHQPLPQPSGSGGRAAGALVGVVAALVVFFGAQQASRELAGRWEAARLASLAPVPDPAPLAPAPSDFYYKGVNFTSEWPDPYGSKSAAEILSKLPSYGVNSVALVPYAGQRPDEPELSFPLSMERDELVAATAKMAHSEGLRVLLKPQIWVRGRDLYPGDLRYDDPADRARWFASYARFVEHYAKLATRIEADMFCVGVEFAQLSGYDRQWRTLIALAREHYSGPVVYAANFGQELESVRFWDALDFIGLDNYYPLPDDRSVDETASRIESISRRYGRPILFTEAGFSTYEMSHREPWKDRPGGALSPDTQARNVDAFLRGYQGRPWLQGVFWWKVGTAGASAEQDGSHHLWGKPAMQVIAQWFRSPGPPMVLSE